MKYKTIGSLVLPCIGIGTWGGPWGKEKEPTKRPINNDNDDLCKNIIKTAIGYGITHIDTAELYGGGYAEETIGNSIQEFNRESLFITTKVKGSNLSYDTVISSAKKSLRNLKIDYIDLYLIHWPNLDIPISETMRAMDYLVNQGLIKGIGVSNFSLSQMIEAQNHSINKIVATQVEYNLQRRDNGRHCKVVESEIIPYCQDNGILIIAYKPFAGGLLLKSGTSKLLDSLAKKYQRTPSQITLAWLLSKKNVITIPRTTNLSHLKDNLDSLDLKLEAEDLLLLEKISFKNKEDHQLSS